MADAARAIIIENGKILLMQRDKEGSRYATLVGGRRDPDESIEACLKREIMEETGLKIKQHQLVYIEPHTAPYNNQYIFLCTVEPHDEVVLQELSEENIMNESQFMNNTHEPIWVSVSSFKSIPFRTPKLQEEIVKSLKKRFPKEPKTI